LHDRLEHLRVINTRCLDLDPKTGFPRRALQPIRELRPSQQPYRCPRRLPALFGRIAAHPVYGTLWVPGAVNLDYGGGPWDAATEFLAAQGVENLVVDPHARTPAHNRALFDRVDQEPPHTVTLANVLNVLPDPETRQDILAHIRQLLTPHGRLYIQCWRAHGKQAGFQKAGTWQECRPLVSYLPEVQRQFPGAQLRAGLIIAAR
jgi:hypothetical protein